MVKLYKKQQRAIFSKYPTDIPHKDCTFSPWFDEDKIFEELPKLEIFEQKFVVCLENRYVEYALTDTFKPIATVDCDNCERLKRINDNG